MSAKREPVLFLSHGSPMNAIEDNSWSRAQAALGASLGKPAAVVAVSAHWCTRGVFAQSATRPTTVHDFGGFPRALFDVEYPAPGDPDLAAEIASLLGGDTTPEWGLDHGTWSVLRRLFPAADVPVVQVSLDMDLSARGHVEAGRKLASLRERGILLVASGTLTHNLRDAFARHTAGRADTPDWADRFDREASRIVQERDEPALLELHCSPDGRHAHPTPDHWLPLLWAYGASDPSDTFSCPVEGFDMGSMSMRSFLWS
jgi:4,5-DOPA dioxygenase extradiol